MYPNFIANTGWTSIKLTYGKLMRQYFTIQNSAISRKYWIISVLSLVIRLIPIFYPLHDFWPLNKISRVFLLPMFSRSGNVTISPFIYYRFWTIEKRDYECWIGSKPILQMLNWFKTDITNVESVQNRYYECWISSKLILWMLNRFKVLPIWNGYKMRNIGLVPI